MTLEPCLIQTRSELHLDPYSKSGCCRVTPHGAWQGVSRDTQIHTLDGTPTLLRRQLPLAYHRLPAPGQATHTPAGLQTQVSPRPSSLQRAAMMCLNTCGNRPQGDTALHSPDGRETSRHRCGPWLWRGGPLVTLAPHSTERAGTPTCKSV